VFARSRERCARANTRNTFGGRNWNAVLKLERQPPCEQQSELSEKSMQRLCKVSCSLLAVSSRH